MNHRCVLKYFSISLLLSVPYIQGMEKKIFSIPVTGDTGSYSVPITFVPRGSSGSPLSNINMENIPAGHVPFYSSTTTTNPDGSRFVNTVTGLNRILDGNDGRIAYESAPQNPVQNIINTLATLQTLTGTTVAVTSAATNMVPYIYRGFKAIGTFTFFQQTDDDQTPTAPVSNLAPDAATNKVPTPSSNLLVSGSTPHSIDLQIQDYVDELYLPFREDMEHKKQQKIAAMTAQGLDASAYVTKADAKIADYTKKVAKILVSKKHGNNLDFSVPPASHWLQIKEKILNKCYTMGNNQ